MKVAFFFLSALSLLFGCNASGESLEEVIESNLMRQISKSQREQDLTWFENHPNLESIFADKKNRAQLIEWLGTIAVGFKPGPISNKGSHEYASASRVYNSLSGQGVAVTVAVPHPRVYNQLAFGLVEAMAAFEPPLLKVKKSKTIKMHGMQAQLFTESEGGCSLLFKIACHTIVQLQSNLCTEKEIILDLARKLDIQRLNRKLES